MTESHGSGGKPRARTLARRSIMMAICTGPATAAGSLLPERRDRRVHIRSCPEPRPGNIWSSSVLADGKLYIVSQRDGTFVVAAQPKFELLAHNKFADDDSRTNASPRPTADSLLMRTDKRLYCIGKR